MANDILLKSAKKEKDWIGLFPWIGEIFSDLVSWLAKGLWAIITFLFGPQDRQETSGNDSLYLKATIISVCLSLFLAAISFYGSYTAAKQYALNHGIAESVAGWIPVAVDGFILLGVLVVFGASLVGARAGWVRFLIFVFAVVSVVFNVAHITEKTEVTYQSILLGSIFPLIVFLASEVTSKQISAYIERKSSLMTNQTLAAEIETRIAEKQGLTVEIETKRQSMLAEAEAGIKAELEALESRRDSLKAEIEKAESQLTELKQQAGETFTINHLKTAYLWGKNPDLKGREVGDELDVSVAWGNRLKREVKPALNGAQDHD